MLKITVFEFIIRGVPEAFASMLAIYALSNKKLEVKRYIISSLLLALCEYAVRMFPINYGVHTILGIFIMVIIACSINKIDVILAIKSPLILTIVLFVLEGLNMLFLSLAFGDSLKAIMSNATLKTICGLPSLICFTIITIIYCFRKRTFENV